MLFGKRYRHDPPGLLELAADLASSELKQQRRAANAVRKDRLLRDEIRLVVSAFHIADEQIATGQFIGDVAALETLRPIAGIVRRLQELTSTNQEPVAAMAATALDLLERETPAHPAA